MKSQSPLGAVKVLHLLGPLRPSGMERMLASAAPYFQAEGVETSVRGHLDGSTFVKELRDAGCLVVLGDPVAGSWTAAREFRDWVRFNRFDIIHIHTEANYLLTAFAARWALGRRHGRIIRTVHSIFSPRGRGRLKRLVQAVLADRLVAAVVAPSPDVKENERGYLRSCLVIFNWVQDDIFEVRIQRRRRHVEGDQHSPIALIVGNCAEVKRHELALEAVQRCEVSLMHLGDEKSASDAELESLDLLDRQGRLRLRGAMPPQFALGRADVFLMPSRYEGMGVALAEALVAGLPAVVSDSPGLQWARRFPGVIVSDDTVDAWRDGIARAIAVPAQERTDLPVDLSAARGAREYARLYRGVLE